ncbi:amidohydrolase family protein [Candidatus Methanomassiliicoccus intestinalis]|uniref:amidohydrolase family protein n=1 Tax=Candidatus Methanomassiliicoccus intestinalis TaxID=1406512 RepID=UPI0037DC9CA0
MILKGNSRATALIGGICTLRRGVQDYEEARATIVFQDGIIKEVIELTDTNIDEHIKDLKSHYDNLLAVRLDNPDNPCHIFPGLIDIHNHIDYNMMPIWERPVKQPWDNRHEWRNCTDYANDIKNLFNYIFANWSKYSDSDKNEDSYTVIQFFSELQAIAGGTTALQESTEIIYPEKEDKKIKRSTEHILLRSTGVSSDMGLSQDQKINSIIDFFKPDIIKIKEEEKAKGRSEEEYFHPPLDTSTWDITEPKDQNKDESYFQEYLEFLKENSVEEIRSKSGGYLVHLAEGRAGNLRAGTGLGYGIDSYSKNEFQRLKDKIRKIDNYAEKVEASRLTLIHGCGIDLKDEADIDFINECSIRVVWSPVSNLLLYDDTPNYLLSKIRPELVCLGSDWAPSGSKHVWDEAKFAQKFAMKYFYKNSAPKNINDIFLDMISRIPAQAVGSEKIGEIAQGDFADFYIVSKGRQIPQQDMVISDVFETFSDFESVGTIIGGNLLFGTQELFDAFQLSGDRIVSLEADMVDENGKEITVDEGARKLRVYIPDVKITIDGKESVVHIDFDEAIKTLDALFRDFNEKYQKNFVRGKLLSSYDLPYRKQIEKLTKKFLP